MESPELTAPLCDSVFKTRVCSHRGAAQVNGTADGSVAALRSAACTAWYMPVLVGTALVTGCSAQPAWLRRTSRMPPGCSANRLSQLQGSWGAASRCT